MPHDDQLSLRQMLDYAYEAQAIVADKRFADLKSDRMLELALVRLLEILGEAANRVSSEKQQQHSEIPWREIIGLRNRLIQGYDIDYASPSRCLHCPQSSRISIRHLSRSGS